MSRKKQIQRLLVANRGEIARRIMRTAHNMGISTAVVFSEHDAGSPFVYEADVSYCLAGESTTETYLNIDAILDAAQAMQCDAIHPGFGFLAENAEFARRVEAAGLVFVGPRSETIESMGSKANAKKLMEAAGVPTVPGYHGDDQSADALTTAAERIGYPILVKASAGGGGKGMRVVASVQDLQAGIATAKSEAGSAFGDERLILEKYLERPRHIEFQILGDAHGHVIHMLERECSIQRRHQKIVEESPSPLLERHPELRVQMADAAVKAGKAIGYESAGTVEFIVDKDLNFYFLEVNTRLQVEHPVTEEVTGYDIVELQLHIARGKELGIEQDDLEHFGHAIEVRLYAEDPAADFAPQTGEVFDWHVPDYPWLRLDSGVETGSVVSVHYDPMIAKLIAFAGDRETASQRMGRALDETRVAGLRTNRAFLARLMRSEPWGSGEFDTGLLSRHPDLMAQPAVDLTAAMVATFAAALADAEQRSVLPTITPGWRNNRWRYLEREWATPENPEASLRVEYRVESTSASQSAFALRLADGDEITEERAEVRPIENLDNGVQLFVQIGQKGAVYSVVWLNDERTEVSVSTFGSDHHFRAIDRLPLAESETAKGAYVTPMPSKVLRVLVTQGQTVDEGDALVVLEAMKMETTVCAHTAGTVTSVFVDEGELLDAKAALVAIDSD